MRLSKTAALALGATMLASALVGFGLSAGSKAPGPEPIAWDEETCAECHMHVGEAAFAAQLQTQEGELWNFDDPGCALRFLARVRPPIAALYFHAYGEETWLEMSQTAFVPTSRSPMGYGLGAIRKGTTVAKEAWDLQQATARVTKSSAIE